jgi:putative transposase
VQRGNNRQACFFSDEDFGYYIHVLTDALTEFDVSLHAYVLMTNHVHLLMTPKDKIGISKVMQSVGRRYVRYINSVYKRTGTLWEGRHKASLVDSENYLLVCQRYIELNPVRAGMVNHPTEYRWSSYQANGQGKEIACLKEHNIYLQLGRTKEERCKSYRLLFNQQISSSLIEEVREYLCHNYPLGNDNFRAQLEQAHNIRFGHKKQGRPNIRK